MIAPRAIIAAAVAGLVLAIAGSIYVRGRADHAAAVAQQDRRASDAARDARERVRACYDGGGLWDQRTGVCSR